MRSFQTSEYLSGALLGGPVIAFFVAAAFGDPARPTVISHFSDARFLSVFVLTLIAVEVALYKYFTSIAGTRRRK